MKIQEVTSDTLPAMTNSNSDVQPAQQETQVAVFDTAYDMPDLTVLTKGETGKTSKVITYHKFRKDEEIRGVYMGIIPYTFRSPYSGEMETKDAAVWAAKGGRWKMNAAAQLVGVMSRWQSKTPFAAVFTGLEENNGKNIAQFDIFDLK